MPAATPLASRPAPALAAFLRGAERRGAVLAELQCGDADRGDAALARAMRQFVVEAERQPMGQWPRRFWTLLLADPGLRGRAPVALELDATDGLAQLGAGPRAALLLRLAAGLDDDAAAAVLGVAVPSYRLALQRALPHHPDGRADPESWGRLREQVHRRIKTLPPPRLVRLAGTREAALAGAVAPEGTRGNRVGVQARHRPRGLLPLLWALLALCAVAFAATFWGRTIALFEGPGPGQAWERALPEEAPASRYGADAGLVAHRDFELLADPQVLAASERLGFHSWLAAQGVDGSMPGATAAPNGPATTAPLAAVDIDADLVHSPGETAHEPR